MNGLPFPSVRRAFGVTREDWMYDNIGFIIFTFTEADAKRLAWEHDPESDSFEDFTCEVRPCPAAEKFLPAWETYCSRDGVVPWGAKGDPVYYAAQWTPHDSESCLDCGEYEWDGIPHTLILNDACGDCARIKFCIGAEEISWSLKEVAGVPCVREYLGADAETALALHKWWGGSPDDDYPTEMIMASLYLANPHQFPESD